MILMWVCLLLLPAIALADSTISFTPPPTDVSVQYLSTVFGVVDGVLHGTSSQILGNMFAVFNAAVMALGGIIVTYTLIVSTMNTAQEGEMMGKKWSSLWVPVRTTLGFSLLIPKASGYCMLQIFVMWVVVQGVGAADKVWNAALQYLNRGGVIVAVSPALTQQPGQPPPEKAIMYGAGVILSGQVCMIAIQRVVNQSLTMFKNSPAGKSVCANPSTPQTKLLCTTSVPDLTATVNFVATQQAQESPYTSSSPSTAPLVQKMPFFSFEAGSPLFLLNSLNGICGTVSWRPLIASQTGSVVPSMQTALQNIGNDGSTASLSRPIGLTQMYNDLLPVAQAIVSNNPVLTPQPNNNTNQAVQGSKGVKISGFSGAALAQSSSAAQNNTSTSGVPWATVPFGEVFNGKQPCHTGPCSDWGSVSGNATLLKGTELTDAVLDYNSILIPVLTLQAEASSLSEFQARRQFITDSEADGWLMAGSYFMDLVRLNALAMSYRQNTNMTDGNSGLGDSSFNINNVFSAPFINAGATQQGSANCSSNFGALCVLLDGSHEALNNIKNLFDGGGDVILT